MDSDKKDAIFRIIQKMLEKPPVIIWGSGATIPFGLPSMQDLNKTISEKVKSFDGSNNNLEEELGKDKYLKILSEIRQIIWDRINEADRKILSDLLSNRDKYSGVLTLIKKFLEPHPQNINIITTNYDRLLEYVMTYHNINFTDGYSGRILSAFNEDAFKDKNIVNLIKVHGSLNWGKINNEIRYTDIFNDTIEPVIIPPGKHKYKETHHSPYRELIQYSDKVIKKANSFFAVGFGFNDEHITPKIIDKINSGTPIVLITRDITKTADEELKEAKNYVLLEKSDTDKTKIRIRKEGKDIIPTSLDSDYWTLTKFMEDVL